MGVYLHEVSGVEDFERYFQIKSDPVAILWSGFATAPDKEKLRKHFLGLLNNIQAGKKHLFYLMEEGTDSLIGYELMTELSADTVESSGHSILSSWQKKGMGTKLYALLNEKARAFGYKYFIGWVSENNIGCIKNLERNGFVRTEESRVVRLAAFDREDVFYKFVCEL